MCIRDSSNTYHPTDTSNVFDPWEGEDSNLDGIKQSTETDPLDPDSDDDMLWDGYDIVDGDSVRRGELYENGNTAMNGIVEGFVYTRIYIPGSSSSEQQGDTDPLNSDTDDDGIEDGEEVYGWVKILKVTKPSSDSDGEEEHVYQKYTIMSDPTKSDTDMDGSLSDGEEYEKNCLPYTLDTDSDGLSDVKEISYGTNPCHYDTDGDHLPDGGVDGWWRFGTDLWKIGDSSYRDGDIDYWEGEDIDGDGVKDSYETDPTKPDTDMDTIRDGVEYFFDLKYYFMNPVSNYDYDGDGYPNAVDTDSDNDGLYDYEEDLDGDGEIDATTISGETYPTYATAYEPCPYDDDSDDDNLMDGEDVEDEYGTLFYLVDYDGDGKIASMDKDTDGDGALDDVDPDSIDYNTQWDNDTDGLNDKEEKLYGTDDNNEDYDGDGVSDGDEVKTYNTRAPNPDSDGDGLPDGFEIRHSPYLDPNDPDVDDDGLADGSFFEGVVDGNGNPIPLRCNWLDSDGDGIYNVNDLDSDGDGLDDNIELHILKGQGTFYVKNTIDGDDDNDLIIDDGEIWTDTNPLSQDSDGDGLPDGWIDGWGYDHLSGKWKIIEPPDSIRQEREGEDVDLNGYISRRESNPILKDTDGDNIQDGDEIEKLLSNPCRKDTDFDGFHDNVDMFPAGNLELAIKIKEIIALDPVDPDYNGADFYTIVDFWFKDMHNNQWMPLYSSTPYGKYSQIWRWSRQDETTWQDQGANDDNIVWDQDNIKTPNEIGDRFTYITWGLPDNAEMVMIRIQLFDDDYNRGTSKDDRCDINKSDTQGSEAGSDPWNDEDYNNIGNPLYNFGERSLNLIYYLDGCFWVAYDSNGNIIEGWYYDNTHQYHSDNDGVGYACGISSMADGEHYSNKRDKNDNCAIYFDIYVSDPTSGAYSDEDQDGILARAESYIYGTDPDKKDTDGDGMDDGWEVKYGFEPTYDNHPGAYDHDSDGISSEKEYVYHDWCALPDRKDIFVEVDWMKGHKMKEKAKILVIRAFARHDISLHIDDGCMGGGTNVPMQSSNTFSYPSDWDNYYNSHFLKLKSGSASHRDGVFHYCLMAKSKAPGSNSRGQGGCPGYSGHTDMFVTYDMKSLSSKNQVNGFIHELGHNLLGLIDSTHQSTQKGDTAPTTHCNDPDCAMYYKLNENSNYCDHCWNELSRDGLGLGLP